MASASINRSGQIKMGAIVQWRELLKHFREYRAFYVFESEVRESLVSNHFTCEKSS